MGKVKRFWVFGFNQYYPGGGLDDLEFMADTLDEIRAWKPKYEADSYQVADVVEGVQYGASCGENGLDVSSEPKPIKAIYGGA